MSLKPIGRHNPYDDAYAIPQKGITLALSTAAAAQAYPSGAQMVRIQSTVVTYVNLDSTGAHVPGASIAATSGSSGRQILINPGDEGLYILSQKTTANKLSAITPTTSGVAIFHFYGTG